jgi:HD superfamily phosphohydrolase
MIIRDPLYNYISIERRTDGWLLDVLDCPEVQRLRRIRQLGISAMTFPGADHNRLMHSLGVLHLMQRALEHLGLNFDQAQVDGARAQLLASALVHDVGHGPFSHLFETCLGVDHEQWSKRIISSEETGLSKSLRKFAVWLPRTVAELVDPANDAHPRWQKYLLSSQLDVDRLDYLRRDSLFTGAGYGHFDWYRLINTLELHAGARNGWDIVWPEKSLLAIEEYIFARYYMYQSVYLHKTTRGFERMLEAIWQRGRELFDQGAGVSLIAAIRDFWSSDLPTVAQYLAIEEFTVLQQLEDWAADRDPALADLARRFLDRNRFAPVEAPDFDGQISHSEAEWENALRALVAGRVEYASPLLYCLRDRVEGKYDRPYSPESASDEQTARNAIRVKVEGEPKPIEVSELLPRLKPLTVEHADRLRYYIPRELLADARKLRDNWK